MLVKEIYEKLLLAKRPKDFFGSNSSENDLKKLFRDYAKIIHPDVVSKEDKYIADEAFSILNRLYRLGITELSEGIYNIVDTVKLYEHLDPMFEIKIANKDYKFYENVFEGEVANIFKGVCEDNIYFLKVSIEPSDNPLLDTEYKVLSNVRHQSFPYVERLIKVNDNNAILMREVKGITMPELMSQYKTGVPQEHVMWILERLLSEVGYLHSNLVVHGNIKPENIIINKENHNVSLVGFSFCIPKANSKEAHYKIINDYYTAPEVSKDALVMPSSDIYSVGKIAVRLLGGNVSNNGMPLSVDKKVRSFIRNMVDESSKRPIDAWELWSELIKVRTEVFGTKRFLTFD